MDIKVERTYKLPLSVESSDMDDVFVTGIDGLYVVIDKDGDFVAQCQDPVTAERICDIINESEEDCWTGSLSA